MNKPHNGRLAAHFPEVTKMKFSLSRLSVLLGLVEKKFISPWEKFVAYRYGCEVEGWMSGGRGIFASSSALEKDTDYSHG